MPWLQTSRLERGAEIWRAPGDIVCIGGDCVDEPLGEEFPRVGLR